MYIYIYTYIYISICTLRVYMHPYKCVCKLTIRNRDPHIHKTLIGLQNDCEKKKGFGFGHSDQTKV
jgi:hypothetical protein